MYIYFWQHIILGRITSKIFFRIGKHKKLSDTGAAASILATNLQHDQAVTARARSRSWPSDPGPGSIVSGPDNLDRRKEQTAPETAERRGTKTRDDSIAQAVDRPTLCRVRFRPATIAVIKPLHKKNPSPNPQNTINLPKSTLRDQPRPFLPPLLHSCPTRPQSTQHTQHVPNACTAVLVSGAVLMERRVFRGVSSGPLGAAYLRRSVCIAVRRLRAGARVAAPASPTWFPLCRGGGSGRGL